jgi:hypothetical protein
LDKKSNIVVFELDGLIPSKKNSKQIFKKKSGQRFITSSNAYKKWQQGAAYQINLQKSNFKKTVFPIKKCVFIRVTLFFGDRKRADNTNKVESVHDLLVDTGIIADDDWQSTGVTTQIPEYREKKPGAYIVIEPAPAPGG